jgi:hypothetical protein
MFELELAVRVAAGLTPSDDDAVAVVAQLVGHGLIEYDGIGTYRLTFIVRHFLIELPERRGMLDGARRRFAHAIVDWATEQTRWGRAVRPQALDDRAVDVSAAVGWAMEHEPALACTAFADFGVMLHGAMHTTYCEWLVSCTERDAAWARSHGSRSWRHLQGTPRPQRSYPKRSRSRRRATISTHCGYWHARRRTSPWCTVI